MRHNSEHDARLVRCLGLERSPVAINFWDHRSSQPRAPSQPSGCSFWKLAAEGMTCHTVPEDHYNCAIGCHTHNIDLPADRATELPNTLELMVQNQYLSMAEVPRIPRLLKSPGSIRYQRLADCDDEPDLVLVCGSGRSLMLLHEAATHAGVEHNGSLLARPTCMSLPAALQGGMVTSLGCVGNRVYTGIGDGEFYAVFGGSDLESLSEALVTIDLANRALGDWHAQRQQALST